MKSHYLTIFGALALTMGCASSPPWLQDSLCDCPEQRQCTLSEADITAAIVSHQLQAAQARAETASQEAGLAWQSQQQESQDESDAEPAYRSAEELAQEPINPTRPQLQMTLDDEASREQFEETYGIAPPDNGQVFQGPFAPHAPSTVAVYRPAQALQLFDGTEPVASLDLSEYTNYPIPDDLLALPAGPIELVRDGSLQLKLLHARPQDDGSHRIVLGIYKVIGNYIGTIFRRPIAQINGDGELTQQADLRYLHGTDHRIIEWIPLDEQGQPQGEPQLLEWNHWEGVYRQPGLPPTAPRPAQSRNDGGHSPILLARTPLSALPYQVD